MKYLVDANVLCEPTRPSPDARALAWWRRHEPDVAIDPIILGEVRYGILLLPAGRRRDNLLAWFDAGIPRVRCLPWDHQTGMRWAELIARLRADGTAMPIKDSLIAATALVHRLTVVTRNVRDFANAGLDVLDSFTA